MRPHARIQIRHDTAANWAAENPILATGEMGYETDTGRMRIGDGSTAWNSVATPSPVIGEFTHDLGVCNRSGSFDVTGFSGLTTGRAVIVQQSAAAIASRGDARDEMEFDTIHATGYVLNATTIRVFWRCDSVVCGEYAFSYVVSG